MKKVTLCIPLYNAESTIGKTLESLLSQDYPPYKIKVFDNQSTDRSVEIVREYANNNSIIELTINPENLGAEGNFTRCIQAAEGDYCALVHSDDIYEHDFITISVKALEFFPSCVASFSHAKEIDEKGRVIGERFYPRELARNEISILTKDQLYKYIYRYGNFITCPSVMVRTKAYLKVIKYWDGEHYKSSADLDVWLRLIEVGNIAAIRKPLIRYRIAEVSHSFRIAKKRITPHDLFLVLSHYKKNLKGQGKRLKDDYRFLMMKDQAIRTLNIIRTKNKEVSFPNNENFYLSLVLKKMFHSKWHFKFGAGIIAIKILSLFLILLRWNKR